MTENVRRRFAVLKWIPNLLLLAILGFAFYVGMHYHETSTVKINAGGDKSSKKIINQTHQIEYSHMDQGRLVYHVTAEQVDQFKSTQQQLANPIFTFYDEDQKETVRITGKLCNISPDANVITVIDDTNVKSQTGMQVSAHVIKYDSRQNTFSAPGMANFKWRNLKGKSKGFVYGIETQELDLLENPQVTFIKDEGDGPQPIVLTGKTGMVDHKNGFAFFEGAVEATQMNNTINAHRLEATFVPGGNDLQKLTAIKDVKIKFGRPEAKTDDEDASKKPATATAPTVPAAPAPDPKTQAPTISNVFVADNESAKDLEAEYAELFFYDDGRTIKSFHSTGDCTFTLHTFGKDDKPMENRIIKGQNFDSSFDEKGNMQQFHANQDVSVKLQPLRDPKKLAEANKQMIYCNDLITDFIPETGDVKEIHFNESFRHVQGTRTVTSDHAVYTGSEKKTDLIGSPEIDDATFDITSTNMVLYEDTSNIHASGNVKSSFVKSDDKKSPSTNILPFSSPSNQPVYISAEDMLWESAKAEATYTEKAKLWQDKNVITAAKLVINNKENTLSAYEKVHTIFYNGRTGSSDTKPATQTQPQSQTQTQSQTGSKAVAEKPDEKVFSGDTMGDGPMSVDAGIMNYSDKDRIIHFEKDVKIVTTTTRINSEKADFFLKEESSDFDKLYAQGRVSIIHDAKRGTGSQATFYSDERKLVMEGNPKLREEGKADVVGRVLTLFLADDRILIDGQEDGRATTTLSTAGGFTSSSSNTTQTNMAVTDVTATEATDSNDKGSKSHSKKRKPH